MRSVGIDRGDDGAIGIRTSVLDEQNRTRTGLDQLVIGLREVAQILKAPLDLMLVRKIGMPGWPEGAIGAIASGNILVHKPPREKEISAETFDQLAKEQRRELERRERIYRGGRPPLELKSKTSSSSMMVLQPARPCLRLFVPRARHTRPRL